MHVTTKLDCRDTRPFVFVLEMMDIIFYFNKRHGKGSLTKRDSSSAGALKLEWPVTLRNLSSNHHVAESPSRPF